MLNFPELYIQNRLLLVERHFQPFSSKTASYEVTKLVRIIPLGIMNKCICRYFWFGLVWWCLTPLSTIFQLYCGGQFYWWRKPVTFGAIRNLWWLTYHLIGWGIFDILQVILDMQTCQKCSCRGSEKIVGTFCSDSKSKMGTLIGLAIFKFLSWTTRS
jgi:hypothetical protein